MSTDDAQTVALWVLSLAVLILGGAVVRLAKAVIRLASPPEPPPVIGPFTGWDAFLLHKYGPKPGPETEGP